MRAKSATGDNLDNITWDPEDLNISVDLQVVIPSRQYNAKDFDDDGDFNLNDAKYQSILSGVKLDSKNGEGYLTTDWTNVSYQEIKNNRAGSKELFGINSIQITFDSHLYPRVTMNFTDVRGSSLMGPQEQHYLDIHGTDKGDKVTRNFFANLFKFPYPRFLLSIKGVCGTCVTFVLSVEDFKATFNSESGNYDVIVKFMGNMYGLYTDIPMNYLLIAPYIGSKSGGFTKNEYWSKQTENNGAFFYNEDGHEGAPIKTFLEFYSEYHCMMGPNSKGLADAYGENLVDMSEKAREIEFLTGDEGIIPKYFDKIPDAVQEGGLYVNGDERGLDYNFIFYEDDVMNVTLSPDFIDDGNNNGFMPAVEAYQKEYANGYEEIFQPDYYCLSGFWKEGKNSYPTLAVNQSDTIFSNLSGFKKSDADKIRQDAKGKKRAYVYSNKLKVKADEYVNKLKDEQSKKLEGAKQEVEGFFKDMFQFSPTVENIMRMLFAHLDTFIHEFYAVIKEIKGTRTLASLKFPKNLTDIESSSEGGAHVPPYTAFYKETPEKKVERIYPGEDSRLAGIAEVKFVEAIVNGIGSMVSWQDRYIAEHTEEDDLADEEETSLIEEMNFTATTLSDIFYEGKNPYDLIASSNLYPSDVIYYFICRHFLYDTISNEDKDKAFAELEAKNFVSSSAFKVFKKQPGLKAVVDRVKPTGDLSQEQFSSKPIFTINTTGYTVEAKDGKIPLKFNGMNPFDDSFDLKKHSGVDVTRYSEEDIEKFANAYGSSKVKNMVGLSHEYSDNNIFMIPLTYRKDKGKYMPLINDNHIATQFADWSMCLNKRTYKKRSESGEEEDISYASFDDFVNNAEPESTWIPSVPFDKSGVKQNLLVGVDNEKNLALKGDKYNSAYIFLSSMKWRLYRDAGEATLARDITGLKGLVGKARKMSKIDVLLISAVAYLKNRPNALKTDKKNFRPEIPIDRLQSGFTENEINNIEKYFIDWVDTEYDTILNFIRNEKAYSYLSGTTKVTTDLDGYGGIVQPNTPFQNYLKGLYKETVIPFFFKDAKTMKMSVDVSAVKKFCEVISDELNNQPSVNTESRVIEVETNFEFNEDSKNSIYYTLKNLYDRWLSMETEESFRLYSVEEEAACKRRRLMGETRIATDRSEFLNFAYVDSFFNDISKKFLINPGKLFNLIGEQFDGEKSYNILEFIGRICQDNKLLFRCLPVYSNVYNADTFSEIFTPHSLYDGTSRTGRRIGNTYLIMYTYEPSHLLDLEQDKSDGVNYGNDSFDIADSLGDITQESLEVMKKKNDDNGGNNYSICAFGVTAAKQNQSYFTKINVGMDNPRVTDYAIMNKFQLANLGRKGGTINGVGVGQDLYSVYSNRSYDCSVEMLGCANIMPMMYFQLNNVPMFKGVYMITKVEHSIQNNTMTTKFTGTRQPKRYIPITQNVFSLESINAAVNRLASQDMKTEYNVGNTKFEVSSYDGSTTFITYDEPFAKFNGSSNYPKGDTFYPWAAVSQMGEILRYYANGGGYVVPFGNYGGNAKDMNDEYKKGSRHVCATAVQMFLFAGFNGHYEAKNKADAEACKKIADSKGFNGCNGYKMYECLTKYGFRPIADHSNIDSVEFRAGDVCVMKYGTYGHVCMYTGKENGGRWVSDFDQNGWWVYNPAKPENTRHSVIVYRFGGKISFEEKEYQK